MAAKIYYASEAPIDGLQGKKVAVIGYGSQGHAHSQNLRDSGIEVVVAQRSGSDNHKLAVEHGFQPTDIPTAIAGAALVIVTLPGIPMLSIMFAEPTTNALTLAPSLAMPPHDAY